MANASDRETRRQAHFAQMQGIFPLPLAITDVRLPGGLELDEDEFVVRTGKDWGASINPLVLTTRRLICPNDPSGRAVAAIRLTEIAGVRLRKHLVGFSSIVIDRRDETPASFPAHINGARIRAEIAAMVEAAPGLSRPRLSLVPESSAGDRYERLRRIGELKASGVLSEAEFEEEKTRILKEP